MTQQEALHRLATIIETDYKHKYYLDNCELYDKYYVLSTGKGWERFLKRLTSRLTDTEFQEVINITIDICKSVVRNLTHVFYRITRSSGVKIEYTSPKKDDFEDVLATFGRLGLVGYMEKRFTDFVKIDPNGWIVIDFKPTDGTQYARPYPVEFYSPDVIDYLYDLNELIYLCVKQDTAKKVENIEQVTPDYTIYAQDGAVKFISHPEMQIAPPYNPKREYVNGDFVGLKEQVTINDLTKQEERTYEVYEIILPEPYYLEQVPAVNVGYLPDESHRGETWVNFFDNAVPFLEKIIKANSESDISMAKHAFPQKVQFVNKCPNNCEMNQRGVFCCDTGDVCPTCNGKGTVEFHRSGIDCIYIPLTPENVQMISLDNIIKYVGVDLETIKYQWDHIIDGLVAMAKRVIYNTDIFSKQEITDTATAKLIEMENMYDTLYIYAVHFAAVYDKMLTIISDITDIKIETNIFVSKDFKLLGKGELIAMLQAAMNAGAAPAVIDAINDELAYSFFGNSPAYHNYMQRKKLIPFQNRTKEQIMLILGSLPKTHSYRMMYSFGDEILNILEAKYPDWANFTPEKKQQLIKEQLDIIEEEMQGEQEINPEPPVINPDEETE